MIVLAVSIKRAAKTIMLHRCDVGKCEGTSATMVEREMKCRRWDERIAWPERRKMLATTIIHI